MHVYENANPDEDLKEKLIALFNSWKNQPLEKDKLANEILLKIRWRQEIDGFRSEDLSPAEDLCKLEDYITAIKTLRKAWLALPISVRDILPEFISDVEGCQFPFQVTSKLSSLFYSHIPDLPEWRKNGIQNLKEWSCDLEMIDLMRGTAEHVKKNHMPKSGRRRSSHTPLIGEIANTCRSYDISVSHSSRSHFVQIINLVLPSLKDPRASITKVMERLSKNTQ